VPTQDVSALDVSALVASAAYFPETESSQSPPSDSDASDNSECPCLEITGPPPYMCPWNSCSKPFEKRHMLRKHYKKHSRPDRCPYCARWRGGNATKDYDRHVVTKHYDFATREQVDRVMAKCEYPGCGYRQRRDNVQRHYKTAHGDGGAGGGVKAGRGNKGKVGKAGQRKGKGQ